MNIVEEIVKAAMPVRPLTEINERECVAKWALTLAPGNLIVEIGCLYGGMTAVLGLAATGCEIITIDDFSWHPEDDVPTSPKLLYENMAKVGVRNVTVFAADSRVFGLDFDRKPGMVWIDGGHSYDWVIADLMLYGSRSKIIAVHDYGNPFWESVKKAVDDFIRFTSGSFEIVEVAGTVAVLKRKQ